MIKIEIRLPSQKTFISFAQSMHPELMNNSLFLRYYQQWQNNPQSIVFASIADFLLRYGQVDEAYDICKEGLERHPYLVTGRIVMAKIFIQQSKWQKALDTLEFILERHPHNREALELATKVEEKLNVESHIAKQIRLEKEERKREELKKLSSKRKEPPQEISPEVQLKYDAIIARLEREVEVQQESQAQDENISSDCEPALETKSETETIAPSTSEKKSTHSVPEITPPTQNLKTAQEEKRVQEKSTSDNHKELEVQTEIPAAWRTLTMANIFKSQGHTERAKKIYQLLLHKNPENTAAQAALAELE
ncbi:MAG: hypothetical protein COV43_05815 [Deltaproteobacteria bacterium CG11_big_fil_rev_8_21_14_0_20_42_23]|nr:MAG: hypothetical protein COV43_05815 [Deltaproteobacteria bacterium CG11_big_fil_rev_8_21_14_0_20_42_23]PJC63682.1 MAG: hypothetical protein CO021_08335 [Deltaproteobacteria bacterium CG_4_9_14_0_2_um_filter_42_21]